VLERREALVQRRRRHERPRGKLGTRRRREDGCPQDLGGATRVQEAEPFRVDAPRGRRIEHATAAERYPGAEHDAVAPRCHDRGGEP
jgi:hypothetical protein